MHWNTVLAYHLLTLRCLAVPNVVETALHKRGVTPDATCGGPHGYACLGSSFGNCCSSNGWWYAEVRPLPRFSLLIRP